MRGSIVHQSYPLRQPEEDASEILVQVRGTTLRRARKRLFELQADRFPWSEILLGVATICIGGYLGALAAGLPWGTVTKNTAVPTLLGVLFYAMMPAVFTGCAVGYLLTRRSSTLETSSVARDILTELPDPDRAK
jgi:hypothetical protein